MDEKAREDEEGIHPQEPSGQQRRVQVKEPHPEDGDAPQAVEGRIVTGFARGVGHGAEVAGAIESGERVSVPCGPGAAVRAVGANRFG